jgi:hypothetical protein
MAVKFCDMRLFDSFIGKDVLIFEKKYKGEMYIFEL